VASTSRSQRARRRGSSIKAGCFDIGVPAERQMGLGSLKTIGLSEAREEAIRCRKLLKDGNDPIETRQAEKAKVAVANAKIMPI
jgi:Arm DNA-binding domain